MDLIDFFLGKLAPHICLGCGREDAVLCAVCEEYFPPPLEQLEIKGVETVHAATIYEGIAKDLVWQLKFRGARAAADVMARAMAPLIADKTGAVIIPVPTATRRVRQRGFDQAKLLAKRISKRTGLQYGAYLRRHGQTHQVGASREQRLIQLSGAFSVKRPAALCRRRVILVDDVTTTGATLEAAAAAVSAAGAGRVEAVVFGQVE